MNGIDLKKEIIEIAKRTLEVETGVLVLVETSAPMIQTDRWFISKLVGVV